MKDHQKSVKIGLVDPIRTAKAYPPELKNREIKYLVIESGLVGEVLAPGSPIVREASLELTALKLKSKKLTHILGCVDPSILYADQLAALLGLPSNGLRRSEARRNKSLMSAAVAEAGLKVPRQIESQELSDFSERIRGFTFPMVVKPVSSGGTDNVHLCHTPEQAIEHFGKILGSRNLMGCINEKVIAQEYIDGIEYVVDCVSYDGVHVPIDFFEYQKGTHNGRAFIYEKERFLPAEDPRTAGLLEFAQRALDALDFRNGASHMELKINSQGQIVFIEVGPRLNGGDIFKIVRDTREDGKGQIDFVIDELMGLPPPGSRYPSRKWGVRVFILSHTEGVFAGIGQLDEIQSLPSFTRIDLNYKKGDRVGRTLDLSNDIGFIDLTSETEAQLKRDEAQLDRLLKAGVVEFA